MSLARPFARRSPGWLPKVSSSPGGRTFRVSPLSRQHVIEYYELREALECASVRLATKRRDPERFELIAQELREAIAHPNSLDAARLSHLSTELDAAIEEAADSRYISAALDDLGGQMARVRYYSATDAVRTIRAAEEHILIAEAIVAGDELHAVSAMAVHLRNSLAVVLRSIPES